MYRIVPAALLVLAACRPPAEIQVVEGSWSAPPSSPRRAEPSAEPSAERLEDLPALEQVFALWLAETDVPARPELVAGWFAHVASGTCLSGSLGEFEMVSFKEYGPDDWSVGVKNRAWFTTVTIYTYPAARDFDAEFAEVMAAMLNTCDQGAAVTFDVGDPRFPDGGKAGACVHFLHDSLEIV